jgi:hypothetical protein
MRFVFRPLASNSSAGVQRRRGAMRAAVLGLAAGVLLRPAKRPPDGPPALQILGMYNSGTNLLTQLIKKNLPEAHPAAYPPDAVWKHAKLSALSPGLRRELRRHAAVAMLRSPLAWLASLEKAPYNLADCTEGADWLTEPCQMPETWRNAGDPGGPPPPGTVALLGGASVPVPFVQNRIPLENVEAVWNRWAADYAHLSAFVRASIVVRYEDLVRSPEHELARIAALVGGKVRSPFVMQDAPAKGHGRPLNRTAALAKLEQRAYLGLFSDADRRAACARLDGALMAKFGYDDCVGFNGTTSAAAAL